MNGQVKALLVVSVLSAFAIFGAAPALAAPPTPETEAASQVGVSSAHLTGSVYSLEDEYPTAWHFEWSTSGEPGTWANEQGYSQGGDGEVAPGTVGAVAVEKNLTGLEPDTEYFIRLVSMSPDTGAGETSVPSEAPYLTLKTDPATPPTLTINPVTTFAYSTAHFSGTIDPNGGNFNQIGGKSPVPITWALQYNGEPGNESSWQDATSETLTGTDAEGTTAINVEVDLPQGTLTAGHEYAVRLRATYAGPPVFSPSPDPTFTTKAVDSPLLSAPLVSAVTSSAAKASGTISVSNPDPAFDAACRFEYVTDAQFNAKEGGGFAQAQQVPCQPETVSGSETESEPAAISAQITGLEPNITYHLRLHASNAGGAATEANSSAVTFTTAAVKPEIDLVSNSPLSATTVRLYGHVRSINAPLTDCRFAYSADSSFDQSAPCDEAAGTQVSTEITGLSPETTYNFRLILTNLAGTEASPDSTFTTLSPIASENCRNDEFRVGFSNPLPDCRAYELVSPSDKNGGEVMAYPSRTHAAANGDAAAFSSLTGFGDARGSGVAFEFLASRDTAPNTQGWSTHAITPLLEPNSVGLSAGGSEGRYEAFTSNLDKGIFVSYTALTVAPNVDRALNLYERDDLLSPGEGSYELLTDAPAPIPDGTRRVTAFTDDFAQITIEATGNLTSEYPGEARQVYELDHGVPRFVAWIPPPGAIECGQTGSLPACEAAPLSVSGGSYYLARYTESSLSTDGNRNFFTTPVENDAGQGGNVYMREANGTADANTVQLNASERTDCAENNPCTGTLVPTPNPDPATIRFEMASADGSVAIFSSNEKLTDEANDEGVSTYLYQYDASLPADNPHNLTLLWDPPARRQGEAVAVSSDGDFVYFATQGDGLFVRHVGNTKLISRSPRIEEFLRMGRANFVERIGPGVRLTSDGKKLLFLVTEKGQLPANGDGQCPAGTGYSTKCAQLYLYDYESGSIVCVSCRADGSTPTSNSDFLPRRGEGGASAARYLNHPITADGSRIFFQSGERLVSEDTNGLIDVYEFDVRTGRVSLISSGTSNEDSLFMDASPDGSDVFFITTQHLVGWDKDNGADLYDARVGGGVPEPLPEPAICQGSVCQGSASVPIPLQPLASRNLSQGGDPPPRRCKKPKVRRKGRCVNKPRRHRAKSRRRNRTSTLNRTAGKLSGGHR